MSNLADYIMGLLVFNVFLVIIVLAVVMFINAKVNKQQKEISFMFTRMHRAKKIEDIRDMHQQEAAEKEKKTRLRRKKP